MITGGRVAPTRLNLLRARRQLAQVAKGADLLRRKREALVSELFRLARPAVDARAEIARVTDEAYPSLLRALATHGHGAVRAMAWPPRELHVDIRPALVWGIPVPEIVGRTAPLHRTLDARGTAPAVTGPEAAAAATRFEHLAELLLDAAPREQRIRRVGEAIAATTRHLRTLEQRVTPTLERRIASVRATLEEREREERLRLKHVTRKRRGPTRPAAT